jgi:hypothetical protein
LSIPDHLWRNMSLPRPKVAVTSCPNPGRPGAILAASPFR